MQNWPLTHPRCCFLYRAAASEQGRPLQSTSRKTKYGPNFTQRHLLITEWSIAHASCFSVTCQSNLIGRFFLIPLCVVNGNRRLKAGRLRSPSIRLFRVGGGGQEGRGGGLRGGQGAEDLILRHPLGSSCLSILFLPSHKSSSYAPIAKE